MALLNEELQTKWSPVLDHPELAKITDPYKKAVTAIVLENQQNAMDSDRQSMMNEGTAGNLAAGISNFDPILISLVRRALPNLIAYDVAGVQPMTGPTGLIFALRSRYGDQSASEAFYNEANTIFSGIIGNSGASATANSPVGANGPVANTAFDSGTGMSTAAGETLDAAFAQMSITIDKVTVSAKTRALKAEYSLEMAQDLKAIHGLDAETELSNVLSTEILAEMNREVIRTIYTVAKAGAQFGTVTSGVFDLDTDSNGRWSVERFKGLIYHIEREANQIAKTTRRGKGNILIVSSDVASALAMAGVLQYTPALSVDLQVDDTGNTFAGLLHGRIKVYIDPYFGGSANNLELCTVGYKGTSPYDSGLFYCPYVPLQMVRAVDPGTFQPKIGFKTRYGLVANPFAEGLTQGNGALNARTNNYYRIFAVKNLM
jgi:Major capsid protein Gp23